MRSQDDSGLLEQHWHCGQSVFMMMGSSSCVCHCDIQQKDGICKAEVAQIRFMLACITAEQLRTAMLDHPLLGITARHQHLVMQEI